MKLVTLLTSISVIFALAGCGDSQTASSQIEKAKKFSASEMDSKLIALKNAVKLEPRNAEARYLLGELYLIQGYGVGAVKELEKAYKYKYNVNMVIPQLARGYILTSAYEDLVDLEKEFSLLSSESKTHYLAYKTLAHIRLEQPELAKESVDLAYELLANNAYTILADAYLEMSEEEFNAAKGSTSNVLAIIPEQVDAILLLAQIHSALKEHAKATEHYLHYAELQPKSSLVKLFIAQSLLKEGRSLEAERYADIILNKSPNQPFANFVKATSQFELQNFSKALQHAENALKSDFYTGQLKLIAGVSAYFLKSYQQSYYHLESIVEFLVPEHPARKMFAASQLQLGMVEGITETLKGFKSRTTEDKKFLSSLSYELAELGAYENAKEVASYVMSDDSDNAEQNMRDGILKLKLNDPSGIQNLKNAVELEPDLLGAELALAYASIQSKDYPQAMEISKKWKENFPEKPGGFNVSAAVYLKKGLVDEAKAELKQSLLVLPKNLFALIELTNLAMLEGDIDEAKRLSDLSLREFPSNPTVLKQYFEIYNNDDAFEHIKALYKSDKKNQAFGLLYTELLLKAEKFTEAVNVIDAYDTSVKSSKKLWQLKVMSHNGLKNIHKAQSILEDWSSVNPYHVEPIILLADFHTRNKDLNSALHLIDKALLNEHKNNVMLKMGKMQLLINKKSIREAKDYFEEIKKIQLLDYVAQGITGKIALLEGDYKTASDSLSIFYKAQPTSKNIILLSQALIGNNQKNKAIQSLESYLKASPDDQNVRITLANIYLDTNPKKAIQLYADILKPYPENVLVLNNVAWLSMEEGDLNDALSYSEKAYALAPNNVNVVDTYAMILLKLSNKSKALSLLVKAHELSRGEDIDVALNYVEALIANSRLTKASQVLETIKDVSSSQAKRKVILQNRL